MISGAFLDPGEMTTCEIPTALQYCTKSCADGILGYRIGLQKYDAGTCFPNPGKEIYNTFRMVLLFARVSSHSAAGSELEVIPPPT